MRKTLMKSISMLLIFMVVFSASPVCFALEKTSVDTLSKEVESSEKVSKESSRITGVNETGKSTDSGARNSFEKDAKNNGSGNIVLYNGKKGGSVLYDYKPFDPKDNSKDIWTGYTVTNISRIEVSGEEQKNFYIEVKIPKKNVVKSSISMLKPVPNGSFELLPDDTDPDNYVAKLTFDKFPFEHNIIKKETGYYPMNAVQPSKHVLNLGYVAPEGNYGVDLFWTHVAAKKGKDTYNNYHVTGKSPFVEPRSGAYNLFDIIGFYKPVKGMTVRAGVYNLLNKKYMTWDNARSIRTFGTSNMICRKLSPTLGCNSINQGVERFHSPERNFKVNVEYQF